MTYFSLPFPSISDSLITLFLIFIIPILIIFFSQFFQLAIFLQSYSLSEHLQIISELCMHELLLLPFLISILQ